MQDAHSSLIQTRSTRLPSSNWPLVHCQRVNGTTAMKHTRKKRCKDPGPAFLPLQTPILSSISKVNQGRGQGVRKNGRPKLRGPKWSDLAVQRPRHQALSELRSKAETRNQIRIQFENLFHQVCDALKLQSTPTEWLYCMALPGTPRFFWWRVIILSSHSGKKSKIGHII